MPTGGRGIEPQSPGRSAGTEQGSFLQDKRERGKERRPREGPQPPHSLPVSLLLELGEATDLGLLTQHTGLRRAEPTQPSH